MALPPLTSPSIIGGMPNPMASLSTPVFTPKKTVKNDQSPEIFTGKTTSEKIASGEIPSKQLSKEETQNLFFPKEKKNPEFFLNTDTAKNVIGGLQDTAQMYHNKAQDISQWGQDVAKDNGLKELGIRIKQKYPEYQNVDDIKLGKSTLEKYPEYQSFVDSKSGILGTTAKVLGGIGSTFVGAPGMIAEGAANIGEGEGKIAQGKYAEGVTQTALGGVQGTFGVATPAMPVASAVMGGIGGTDLGGKVLGGLSNIGGQAFEKGSELLGADEATQEYSKQLGENVGPLIALKGVSKGGEYIAPKVMPIANKVVSKVGEMAKGIAPTAVDFVSRMPGKVKDVGISIIHPIDTLSNVTKGTVNVVDRIFPGTKEKIAGFDPQTKYAFENSTPEKVTQVLKDAEDAKINPEADYNQTPFHKGMEEGAKTLETVNSHIGDLQDARMKTLENSGVPKIDQKVARETLAKELEKNNVASISVTKDGTPIIESKPGRDHTLGENPKDIEAYQKLQNLLSEDVSPVQMMDRIHNLQSWMYDNATTPLVKGISGKMEGIVKKVTGSLNETFKNQLPKEYREILSKMEEEIKMKQDIKRIFGIDDKGNPVRNIGEGVMKRLANGTTTSGEARALAKQIKEKFGFDLIREARLRQASMEIVGDPRAASLFDVLSDPKKWLKNTIQEGLVDKKSTAMKLAGTGKDPIIPKEPTIPKTKENVGNNRSNPASTPNPKIGSISNIPGAQKTTVEVPSNPKGNQSKTLAGKQGVMVEEQKLLTSGKPIKPTKKK